jgi:heme A synthase
MRAILPGPLTRYQLLAVTTVVLTLVLIAVGALVRTTGSGLGCPDWPLCHGRLVPPLERTAIIEYSHRTLAAIVGLLIVATSAATLRARTRDLAARTLAVAVLPLLGIQAYLGKVTVERELPAEVVAVHLGTALALVGVLAVIAAFAVLGESRTRVESRERDAFLRKVATVVAVVAAVLLAGAYVVGSGSTTACTTWPGCAQAPLPFLDGGREQMVHWFHRLTVLGGLAAVGWLLFEADRLEESAAGLRFGARTLALLYGLQIAVGALNIWSRFAPLALVGHLALAAAIWMTLVLMLVAGRYAAQPAPFEERANQRAASPRGALRQPGAPSAESSSSGNRG